MTRLLFALTLISGTAHAGNNLLVDTDTRAKTSVIGHKGSALRMFKDKDYTGINSALTGLKLTVSPSTGEACRLQVDREVLDQGGSMSEFDKALYQNMAPQCVPLPGYPATTTETVHFSANGHFIRGVNVCLSGGDTIKQGVQGIKIWAAKVDKKSGNIQEMEDTAISKSNQCKNWQTKTFCPSGQVAYNIVGHYSGLNLQGVQLVCADVKKW